MVRFQWLRVVPFPPASRCNPVSIMALNFCWPLEHLRLFSVVLGSLQHVCAQRCSFFLPLFRTTCCQRCSRKWSVTRWCARSSVSLSLTNVGIRCVGQSLDVVNDRFFMLIVLVGRRHRFSMPYATALGTSWVDVCGGRTIRSSLPK